MYQPYSRFHGVTEFHNVIDNLIYLFVGLSAPYIWKQSMRVISLSHGFVSLMISVFVITPTIGITELFIRYYENKHDDTKFYVWLERQQKISNFLEPIINFYELGLRKIGLI